MKLSHECCDVINNSVLLDFICNKFRGTTLLEIEKNYKIYESIIKILNTDYFQSKDNGPGFYIPKSLMRETLCL